ncbi:MAG: hypothetical protein JRN68_07885 [Nitrososphaerota archaeon]|nr:hypothetical protein [Nitrososphaerota archaeon]
MSERSFRFQVNFKAKEGWVDDIFLGNLLAEVLGSVQKSTNAFDFEIKNLQQEGSGSQGQTK